MNVARVSSYDQVANDDLSPKWLSAFTASDGAVPDHTKAPVFVMGCEVATLEVFFSETADDMYPKNKEFPQNLAAFRSTCDAIRAITDEAASPVFDFIVHRTSLESGSGGGRRRVAMGWDWSWLRQELCPDSLQQLNSAPAVARRSSEWRRLVIAALTEWVARTQLVSEQERFAQQISSINNRLAFEYHSFLCGVGNTSQPIALDVLRICSSVQEWCRADPRALFFAQPASLRMQLPLFSADASSLVNTSEQLMKLMAKLSGGRWECGAAAPLLECVLDLDVSFAGSQTPYRVVHEELCATFHVAPLEATDVAEQWGLLFARSCLFPPWSGQRWGGRALGDVCDGYVSSPPPSFIELHRRRDTTLMEYLPLLEEYVRDVCLGEPLHFLELVDAMAAALGEAPHNVSPFVHPSDGSTTYAKRFALFYVKDPVTLIGASVSVVYEGLCKPPTVTVCAIQHLMPFSQKPLAARARIACGNVAPATRYDAEAMAAAVASAANERLQQIVKIIETSRNEERRDDDAPQKVDIIRPSVPSVGSPSASSPRATSPPQSPMRQLHAESERVEEDVLQEAATTNAPVEMAVAPAESYEPSSTSSDNEDGDVKVPNGSVTMMSTRVREDTAAVATAPGHDEELSVSLEEPPSNVSA